MPLTPSEFNPPLIRDQNPDREEREYTCNQAHAIMGFFVRTNLPKVTGGGVLERDIKREKDGRECLKQKHCGDKMEEAEADGGHLPWKNAPTAVHSCTFDPRTEPQRRLTSFYSNV